MSNVSAADVYLDVGLANIKDKQMARFVLVHGGFSGAWIWLPLIDSLKDADRAGSSHRHEPTKLIEFHLP